MKKPSKEIIILSIFSIILLGVLIALNFTSKPNQLISTLPLIKTAPTPYVITPDRFDLPNPDTRPKATNLNQIKFSVSESTSIQNISKISNSLPLYLKDFPTSAGINTTINIFQNPGDPKSILHLEIYDVNYQESSSDPKNLQLIAFKESLQKAKEILIEKGVDIKSLRLVFGTRQFVQDTAQNWINQLNLLN